MVVFRRTFPILISLASTLLVLGGCHPLYRVEPIGKPGGQTTGIVYVLPQTELIMDVKINRTVLTLGRFAKFAHSFGLSELPADRCPNGETAVSETETRMSCAPEVVDASVTAVSVPDADMRFHVTILSERAAVDRALNFKLAKDGRIAEAGAMVDDRGAEVATRVITKVLEIAMTAAKMAIGGPPSPLLRAESEHPCAKKQQRDRGLDQACGSFLRLAALNRKRNEIIDSLEASGSEGSAEALAILNDEIDSLKALFSVTQSTIERTVRRAFIPRLDQPSQKYYVTDKGELVAKEAGAPDPSKLALTLTVSVEGASPAQRAPITSNGCGTTTGKGMVYRLPASGTVRVATQERTFATERVDLPQFGRLVNLPHCFRKKKTTLDIAMSQETGMLESVSLQGTSLPSDDFLTDNLTTLNTASQSLAEAIAAKGQADAATDEQLDALTKEKKLLEAQKEVLEAQRQVNCYEQTGKPCEDD